MSLLSGMQNLFENKVAMEAAENEIIFEEMVALESSEIVDTMVDGEQPFVNDDISQMVDEDEEEEEINKELDEEDNSIASNSNECDNCFGRAQESAALTGKSFLASLLLDNNDPVKTKPGSIGQQDSAATFDKNYSDETDNDNDPIKTLFGSIGQKDSSANHKDNFSNGFINNLDPIETKPGSVGQRTSNAKDPVMENMSFLASMVSDSLPDIGLESVSKTSLDNLTRNANILGIDRLSTDMIGQFIEDKDYNSAMESLQIYSEMIDNALDNPNIYQSSDKLIEAANSLKITTESMMIGINAQKMIDAAMESGADDAFAKRNTINKIKAFMEHKKSEGTLSSITEAAIMNTIGYYGAMESDEYYDEDDDKDPEATRNGSVGQCNSKAHYENNFSNGFLDETDPIKTRDGAEGQQDSAATFDKNYCYGILDEDDPVHTDDGSVGQKDSTAKDPASEAMTALEELEALTKSMEIDALDEE